MTNGGGIIRKGFLNVRSQVDVDSRAPVMGYFSNNVLSSHTWLISLST